MEHELIVSAIGYNSVIGTGVNTYWNQLLFKNSPSTSGVIEVVDPQKYMHVKGQKFLNKASLIYCNIAFQCINERGLTEYISQFPDKVGLYDSSELSNIDACFQFDLVAKNEGPDYVSPMNAPNTIANAAASQMAIQAAIKGPNFTVCSGACSSLQAVDIACLHLKQGLINFAIVGSTEVVNSYQAAVRRGEKRNNTLESQEQGAALLIEKQPVGTKPTKALAILSQFNSGTQLKDETQEDFLWRLIHSTLQKNAQTNPVDLCIIAGGSYALNASALRYKLKQQQFNTPFAYPEKVAGAGDNAGGILGIMYAMGLFQGKVPLIDENLEQQQISSESIKRVLIISVDSAGGASVAVVTHPI